MFSGELVKKKKKKDTMRYHMWYLMPESNEEITKGQKGNANLVAIAIQDDCVLPSNC